ncbi:unnamed protein product [Paramecium sonneborni]|uniref:Uncharacterized protein n=1 Tax=Paramecium sonneborni TaxID=65129 RepID=A0A8S1RPT9_9CILI|nr:unnamed protein product [Paramecium sonneborni]
MAALTECEVEIVPMRGGKDAILKNLLQEVESMKQQ